MRLWQRCMTIGAITLGGALTSGVAAADTLSLTQALEMGMQKSPNVRSAKYRTESAEAQTSAARAPYLPSLSLSGTFEVGGNYVDGSRLSPQPNGTFVEVAGTQAPGSPFNPAATYRTRPTATARISWTVWDFGKTSNNVAAADANRDAASANEKETSLQVASSIASAYLSVFYQDRFLELANATLQSRDKLNAITKGLVKNGIQPPMEEIRAGSRLEAARRDAERAKAGSDDARMRLALALGMEPAASGGIRVTQPRLPRPNVDSTTALKEAEEKRPQLLAAQKTADAKVAAKDAAWAGYLPNVFVTATGTLSAPKQDPLEFAQKTRDGALLIGVSEQWDFGISPRVDAAKADQAAAEADLEATRRDTKSDALSAAISVRATGAQLDHARKAEEGTQAVRAIVEARYIRGLSSPLELIDAEDSDIDARQTRIQTELDHALAIVRLCVATGRPITEEAAQ